MHSWQPYISRRKRFFPGDFDISTNPAPTLHGLLSLVRHGPGSCHGPHILYSRCVGPPLSSHAHHQPKADDRHSASRYRQGFRNAQGQAHPSPSLATFSKASPLLRATALSSPLPAMMWSSNPAALSQIAAAHRQGGRGAHQSHLRTQQLHPGTNLPR